MWPSARRSPLRATLALLILGAARIITPVYAAAPPTGAALAGPIPTPTAEIDSQVTDAPSQLELAKRFLIQDGDAGFGANGGFVGWIYDGQKYKSKVCSEGSLQIQGNTLGYCCQGGFCNAVTTCENGLLKAQGFLTYSCSLIGHCYTGYLVQSGGLNTAIIYDCGVSTSMELIYQASTDAPNFSTVDGAATQASQSFLVAPTGKTSSSPAPTGAGGSGSGSSSGDGGGGLSTSDIIALAVGIPCALVAIGGIWVGIKRFCTGKKR